MDQILTKAVQQPISKLKHTNLSIFFVKLHCYEMGRSMIPEIVINDRKIQCLFYQLLINVSLSTRGKNEVFFKNKFL